MIPWTDEGLMDLDMRFFDSSDTLIYERAFYDVEVTDTAHIITDTDRSIMTTLSVDEDGDGVYDETIYPSVINGDEQFDIRVGVSDLEHDGSFSFSTIALSGNNTSVGLVFVEIWY